MNDRYFTYYERSIDFTAVGGIALLVLIGGYVVIQSIFRISINDKNSELVDNFGRLGQHRKQIKQIVRREGYRLAVLVS